MSTPENTIHQKCTILTLTDLKELIINKKMMIKAFFVWSDFLHMNRYYNCRDNYMQGCMCYVKADTIEYYKQED